MILGWDIKIMGWKGYKKWSHDQGKVFAGILVRIHRDDGYGRARDIGLTAGRWTSLAAHYFGVFCLLWDDLFIFR